MDNPTPSTNTSGPTKETIELMKQTFWEVAPNLTIEQQVPLMACIVEAQRQHDDAHSST